MVTSIAARDPGQTAPRPLLPAPIRSSDRLVSPSQGGGRLQESRKGGVGATDRNMIVGFVQSVGILVFDPCPVTAVLASYDRSV